MKIISWTCLLDSLLPAYNQIVLLEPEQVKKHRNKQESQITGWLVGPLMLGLTWAAEAEAGSVK